MTTSRLAALLAFIAFGLGTIFLLPKGGEQPSGIRLELPNYIGEWKGTDAPILETERATLGEQSGTQFARKKYRNFDGYELLVSIVLSGHDMSTAIHRPERCQKAQGWTVQESSEISIPLAQSGAFPVTRLRNTRLAELDGKQVTRELQTCYWFVGSDRVTAGHWSRWAIDNRDRLLKGQSQRWAFILVSGTVPFQRNEKLNDAARQWSQKTIGDFIKALAPIIHLDSVHYD